MRRAPARERLDLRGLGGGGGARVLRLSATRARRRRDRELASDARSRGGEGPQHRVADRRATTPSSCAASSSTSSDKLDEAVRPRPAPRSRACSCSTTSSTLVPGGYVGRPRSTRTRATRSATGSWRTSCRSSPLRDAADSTTRGHIYGVLGRASRTCSRSCSESRRPDVLRRDRGRPHHLVFTLFPQFFRRRPRRRACTRWSTSRGTIRYGAPFARHPTSVAVEVPFTDTLDGWVLRVAERDTSSRAELRAQARASTRSLIGGAVAVILAGLGVPRDRDPARAPRERAQERLHLERLARAEDAAVDHLDVRRDARDRPHEERPSRRPSTPRSSGARACGSAG